ncbi:hypothetical protein ACWA7J_05625 [Leptothrix sp. BB-4]
MSAAASNRKTWLWAAAAAVVAWSGWIVIKGDDTVEPVAKADRARLPVQRMSPTGPGTALAGAAAADAAAPAASGATLVAAARLEPAARADAFGARSFEPPPPPPPKAAPVVAAPPPPPAAPVVAPPPPPPTLPYKFVGMLETLPSAKPQVFLSIGDKLLVAAAGDALDGGFRLEAIKPTELVFIHVQQGVTVRMPLSGAPS